MSKHCSYPLSAVAQWWIIDAMSDKRTPDPILTWSDNHFRLCVPDIWSPAIIHPCFIFFCWFFPSYLFSLFQHLKNTIFLLSLFEIGTSLQADPLHWVTHFLVYGVELLAGSIWTNLILSLFMPHEGKSERYLKVVALSFRDLLAKPKTNETTQCTAIWFLGPWMIIIQKNDLCDSWKSSSVLLQPWFIMHESQE